MNFSLWFTGLSIWTQDLNKQTSERKQNVTSQFLYPSIVFHGKKKKKKKEFPFVGKIVSENMKT